MSSKLNLLSAFAIILNSLQLL